MIYGTWQIAYFGFLLLSTVEAKEICSDLVFCVNLGLLILSFL